MKQCGIVNGVCVKKPIKSNSNSNSKESCKTKKYPLKCVEYLEYKQLKNECKFKKQTKKCYCPSQVNENKKPKKWDVEC